MKVNFTIVSLRIGTQTTLLIFFRTTSYGCNQREEGKIGKTKLSLLRNSSFLKAQSHRDLF